MRARDLTSRGPWGGQSAPSAGVEAALDASVEAATDAVPEAASPVVKYSSRKISILKMTKVSTHIVNLKIYINIYMKVSFLSSEKFD